MRWARVAVLVGALMLGAGFYVGVESPVTKTVSIAGDQVTCGYRIGTETLAGDVGDSRPSVLTASERRHAAAVREACGSFVRQTEWAVWTSMVLGALVLLLGVAGIRESGRDAAIKGSSPPELLDGDLATVRGD
ncbi:MAG: hypothetical protein ACJ72D_19085 [Marmoricola sp.]